MIGIIYELESEGLYLWEAYMNLKEQGYGSVFDKWLEDILNSYISEIESIYIKGLLEDEVVR